LIVQFRDRDHGAKKLLEQIKSIKGAAVDVGVLGDKAAASHGETTVADVATFHEFGLGVPERSFIRGYVDENEAGAAKLALKAAQSVAKGLDVDTVLNVVGLSHVGGMQARIAEGIDPALSPATIEKKGSATPLVDTGQLRSAITHRIVKR
jgi:hypothetical protein